MKLRLLTVAIYLQRSLSVGKISKVSSGLCCYPSAQNPSTESRKPQRSKFFFMSQRISIFRIIDSQLNFFFYKNIRLTTHHYSYFRYGVYLRYLFFFQSIIRKLYKDGEILDLAILFCQKISSSPKKRMFFLHQTTYYLVDLF